MFTWSGAGVQALFYVIVLGIALAVWSTSWRHATSYNERHPHSPQPFRHVFRPGTITFVVLMAIVWACNFGISHAVNPSTNDDVTVSEVSAALGLQNDHAYPLVLGDRIAGSSGSGTTYGGFFSSATTFSTHPASAVTVSYTVSGKSYVLELPTSQITFIQGSSPQTVQLHLAFSNDDYSADFASWQYTYSGCEFKINILAPSCMKHVTSKQLVLDPAIARAGLASFVQPRISSAVIHLTPAAYQQLIGASVPTAPSTNG